MSLIPIKKNQKPKTAANNQPTAKVSQGSTQAEIHLITVKDGIAIMKDGSLCTALMTSSVNFALKNEEEQNAIVYAYQSFLNSLVFPIQILVQSRHLNLRDYLAELENRRSGSTNALLQIQIKDYIAFIKKMLSVANIMDKRFYVIIPYYPTATQQTGIAQKFSQFMMAEEKEQHKYTIAGFDRFRKELLERTTVVASGLAGLDVRAVQLNSKELVELLYKTYNPDTKAMETMLPPETLSAEIEKRTKS